MSGDERDDDDSFEPDLEIVTPDCCDMVKETKAVFLGLPKGFYGGEPGPPKWQIRSWNDQFQSVDYVEAQYCPHCAKPVPEIISVNPPRPVCVCTDGGYYCDTCSERLNSCRCLRPEKAWGPKKDETNT